MKKHICPTNGWDCPYYFKGLCCMEEMGVGSPMEECDDFAYFYGVGDDFYCDCENN